MKVQENLSILDQMLFLLKWPELCPKRKAMGRISQKEQAILPDHIWAQFSTRQHKRLLDTMADAAVYTGMGTRNYILATTWAMIRSRNILPSSLKSGDFLKHQTARSPDCFSKIVELPSTNNLLRPFSLLWIPKSQRIPKPKKIW